MKLKTAGLLTIISVLGVSGAAHAEDTIAFYVGGNLGLGGATLFAEHDTESAGAISYGAMFGVDIPLVRIEAEYNYLDNDNFNTNLAMANVYLKLPSVVVHPYIGAGAGVSFDGKMHVTHHTHLNAETAPAFQGMMGITFDIPVAPLKVDVEGRLLYIPDAFEIFNSSSDLLQYEARVKLRLMF